MYTGKGKGKGKAPPPHAPIMKRTVVLDTSHSSGDDSSSDAEAPVMPGPAGPPLRKKPRTAGWDDDEEDEDLGSADDEFDDLFDVRVGGGGDGIKSPPLLSLEERTRQ